MRIPLGACLIVCTLTAAVTAEEFLFLLQPPPATEPEVEKTFFEQWFEADHMTSDWGGIRDDLEDIGIKFDIFSNNIHGFNFKGGGDTTNAYRFSHTYDLLISIDLGKMELIPGGLFFMHYQGWLGRHRNINNKVGAFSDPFDDADGHKGIYIDQFWYQQSLLDKKIKLRFGYLDQQTIIDRNAYANSEDRQFMNTLLDNNNAIIPLTIGLGATLFIEPTDWLAFLIGAADADGRPFRCGFDTAFHDGADFFGYFQLDLRLKFPTQRGPLSGTYRFGVFYDPRTRPIYSSRPADRPPDLDSDDVGFYFSFDQLLYRESDRDLQGLGAFARYGFRHPNQNQVEHSWSVGFQYEGLIEHRDRDVFGFGVYSVHASDDYQGFVDANYSRETGFEWYYSVRLTPWLIITPDLQYIVNAGGSRDARDAIVFGIRTRFIL